jgi:glycosyltransferase involved in cell wall biosynthesis
MQNGTQQYDVLCFGGGDWWYHNQAHIDMQIMRRFAKNRTVVYVNSLVVQKPKITQGRKFVAKCLRKAKSIFTGLKKTDAGFWAYSPVSLPLHHIRWARFLNENIVRWQIRHIMRKLTFNDPIIWVACPAACDIALSLKKSKLVYQRADRWEEFPNVDKQVVCEYDHKLKSEADLTIFVSESLYAQESALCRNAVYLDHGVDYEMFAKAEQDLRIPSEMNRIRKPVIGFFGGIDEHTFDILFMEKVIKLLPEMSFVFIGKASIDCSGLIAQKNVFLLGQKPYEEIPHYGKCFDAAIMPWRQNRWIQACNPVKLKEYLALGKPVVTTPFAELQKYHEVAYEAQTPEQFVTCIKKALQENCPDRIAARRRKVMQSTWDSKAEMVLTALFGSLPSDYNKEFKLAGGALK